MPWIRTVEPGGAAGMLKAEYDQALARAGKVYNIVKLQSLNARTLRASIQFYLASMHGPSALTRTEREMLGTVVSRVNACFY